LSRPLIGITTYRADNKYGYPYLHLSEYYAQVLVEAGANPVLLPVSYSDGAPNQLSAHLDGIVLSGGGDIDPALYGSQPHPLVDGVDNMRDSLEIELVKRFLQARKPFLGICRGLQVINVAMGGTLYEDITEQYSDSLKHDCFPLFPREHLTHTVQIESGTTLYTILKASTIRVNSLHHQAIRQLASGLNATARAPDGVIEAIECTGHPFGLGVQWHPENLPDDPASKRLFSAFVQAVVAVLNNSYGNEGIRDK
jgi:putative glutamine amidotransferase